jgi:hypothetical protein
MTVATLTNKAVTAIFNANSNQNTNSGDTKCILGEGLQFALVGSLPARHRSNCSTDRIGNTALVNFTDRMP